MKKKELAAMLAAESEKTKLLSEKLENIENAFTSYFIHVAKSMGYKQGVYCLFGEAKIKREIQTDVFHVAHGRLFVKDLNGNGDCVFDGQEWAEIIEQPKSILDGKVAVIFSNQIEMDLICKHYNLRTNATFKGIRVNYPTKVECFYIDAAIDFKSFSFDNDKNCQRKGYKIIPFEQFAKEVGIEVPVFIMNSEDGVDLYEGDNYFHVWITGMKWEVLLNSQNKKGSFKFNVDGKFPETDKAFSTREAAEKWIEQANKTEEIVGYKLSNGKTANITHKSIRVFNGNDWFNISPSDVEDLHHALKQLKGGDNA